MSRSFTSPPLSSRTDVEDDALCSTAVTTSHCPSHAYPLPLPLPVLTGAELAAHPWDEDEICVHSVGSLQGVTGPPYMAVIFDIRLRRWYIIISHLEIPGIETKNTDSLLDHPYWLNVLRSSGHRGRDDFNQITVPPAGEPCNYSLNPIERSGIPIYELQSPPSAPIPSIVYHELRDRQYLFRSTEKCSWGDFEGVVFKQILEGRGEVTRFLREIALLHHLHESDCDHFLPVLAYVVDEYGRMRGFLVPYGGRPLDELPTIRWQFFLEVLEGLRKIYSIPVNMLNTSEDRGGGGEESSEYAKHGDLCARNVLVNDDGKVHLIDVGNEVWEYAGDRCALVKMASELKIKAETEEDARKIDQIIQLLNGKETFEYILEQLRI